jgi:hypothetical protein
MSTKQFAGILGFAFVAVWIASTFGYALLCLLGALFFYALAAVLEGEVDLGEMQDRLRGDARRSPSAGRP